MKRSFVAAIVLAAAAAVPASAHTQQPNNGNAHFLEGLAGYRGMPRQKPNSDKICLQRKRGGGTVCHTREHWWRLAAKPARRR